MDDQPARSDVLRSFLGVVQDGTDPTIDIMSSTQRAGFTSHSVQLRTTDDTIPAILAIPGGKGPFPGVVVLHQHAGQRHLGKSEVFGLEGDPNQAFGVALAQAGIAVLAPDSIAFEDRRPGGPGTDLRPDDWHQHYNQLTHRLVQGETLMGKVLVDAMAAVSALAALPEVDPDAIGALGHSYGGNTTLFLMAVDERLKFGCASGALGSYRHKIEHGIAIEMAEVIPGFASRFDLDDVIRATAPRCLFAVSGTADPFAADASELAAHAATVFDQCGAPSAFAHLQVEGEHALDLYRFNRIVEWTILTGNDHL